MNAIPDITNLFERTPLRNRSPPKKSLRYIPVTEIRLCAAWSRGTITQVIPFRPTTKLVGIQSLRAVAALMVVGRHYIHALQSEPLETHLWNRVHQRDWLAYGQAGVDIFFVISGFIIMYVTPRPLRSLGDVGRFLLRRIARIYPAYWAVFFVLLGWRCWKEGPAGGLPGHPELLAWIFLLPYQHLPPVLVAWTLVYEVHFYVVAAIIFMATQRWRLYLATGWLLLLVTINLPLWDRSHWDLFTQFYLSPFPLEFLGGLFIADALRQWPQALSLRAAAILCGAALATIPTLGSVLDVDHSAGARVLAYGPAAMILVWAVAQMDAQGKWPHLNRLSPLGDRSYSLYLLHTPVLTGAMEAGARLLPHPGLLGVTLASLGAFVTLGVLVELSYQLVERPAQNAARRMAPHTEISPLPA